MILIGDIAQVLTKRQWTVLQRMSGSFLDILQGLTTLKILGISQHQAEKIKQTSEKFRTTTMSVLRIAFLSALVLELVATLSTAVIAVEVGLRLLYAKIQYQHALFILIIAPEFYVLLYWVCFLSAKLFLVLVSFHKNYYLMIAPKNTNSYLMM